TSGRNSSSASLAAQFVVATLLDGVGQRGVARGLDASVDQNVNLVGSNLLEELDVVRYHQHAHVGMFVAHGAYTAGYDAQRVDVESGVGLVEQRQGRRE